MRVYWMLGLLMVCAVLAQADHIFPAMHWPGWHVSCGGARISATYPLSNMLDGTPASAWVLDGKPNEEKGESPFNHGKGVTIALNRDGNHPITLDSIGLINGYAKGDSTYRRNNRIRTIHVRISTTKGWWGKSFPLQETREMQWLTFPRIQTTRIYLSIEKVDAGADDDLCISEFALRNSGTLIPWEVTPYFMQNNANYDCGCGGGPNYQLCTRNGSLLIEREFVACAMQPESVNVLACTKDTAYLYDLTTGKELGHHKLPGVLSEPSGWVRQNTADLVIEPTQGDYTHARWYQLTVGNTLTLTEITKPKTNPSYLTETLGPYYGA